MRSLIVSTVASFSLLALTAASCDPPPPAVVYVKPVDVTAELQKRMADALRECKATGKVTLACEIIAYWDLDRRRMRATRK